MKYASYELTVSGITGITEVIRDYLSHKLINHQVVEQAVLLSEEILLRIYEQLGECRMEMSAHNSLGGNIISMKIPGRRIDITRTDEFDTGAAIIGSYSDKIEFKYRSGINYFTIKANQPYARITILSLLAFVLAIPFSVLLKAILTPYQLDFFASAVLYSSEFVFSRFLSIIAAPITFFSLLIVVSKNANIFENRDIYNHTLLRYIFTSFLAVFSGYISWKLFTVLIFNPSGSITQLMDTQIPPGEVYYRYKAIIDSFVSKYIPDIIPNANLIHIIVLALLCGISLGSMGNKADTLINISDSLNDMLCHMLSFISAFFPLFTFTSSIDLFISYDHYYNLLHVLLIVLLIILFGLVIMTLFYSLILLINRINPIKFFSSLMNDLKVINRIGSSLDSIPFTIRCCHRRFSISLNYLNFVIPLGSKINMDGNCIILSAMTLLLISFTDIKITVFRLILMFVIIVLLSIGAPNQPGSNTICFLVLLPFLGVDTIYIPFAILLDAILGMTVATFNVVGDMITAVTIARRYGITDAKSITNQPS